MNLIALGISHNSAAVDMRERVAFAPEQVAEAMEDACQAVQVEEVVILSTCNRTEIYAIVPDSGSLSDKALELIDWMASYHHLSVPELKQYAYHHESKAALRHLIQVASGLDSMVLGEPQIFGQLKSAYVVAKEAGTVGGELGRLFPRIFALAKRVRTDTAIGENPVSVAYAAADIAGHIFSDLGNCNALLVGAGETIELVARHLIEAGVNRIVIANRTLGRARELAQKFGAEAVLLAEIPAQLGDADIVITSTASQLPILGKGAVEQALKARKHRPYLMVDLAVPRDIETQVGDLRDVYLYSVDDLSDIVDKNLRSRHDEARKADVIIDAGIEEYVLERRGLGAVDVVLQYRGMAEGVREQELARATRALERGDDPVQIVAQLARGITNKLIHAPTAGLKQASAEGRQDLLNHAQRLLGLEGFEVEPVVQGDTQPSSFSTAAPDPNEDAALSAEPDSPDSNSPDLNSPDPESTRRTLQ
ncbi:MAG: glutamyl-tRNA reductase [Bacteroidia bacterium]|jgi:glutamyl-tRNA reductase